MSGGYTFQQDGAPAHTARVTQEWLHANCPEIIEKDRWPPNSQISTPLTITCGGPCWKGITNCSRSQRQSPSFAINMGVRQMPQVLINKAIKDFTKRLKAGVQVNGGHFEHLI